MTEIVFESTKWRFSGNWGIQQMVFDLFCLENNHFRYFRTNRYDKVLFFSQKSGFQKLHNISLIGNVALAVKNVISSDFFVLSFRIQRFLQEKVNKLCLRPPSFPKTAILYFKYNLGHNILALLRKVWQNSHAQHN